MNDLEKHLNTIDSELYNKFLKTKHETSLLLAKYSSNFPTYTDHSSEHTLEVFKIASEILSEGELLNLNGDEAYILSMSCLLHDIGMCLPEERIKEISDTKEILDYREAYPTLSIEEFIRNIHHTLSSKFILEEWELLNIPSTKYATAIAIVSEGHRKVDLSNFEKFNPNFFAKSGKEFVCLPYLACVLRTADELDVTNSRTPKLLTKYYMPNNETSVREWKKHISTSQRNYLDNKVIFEVDCSDQNIYAALQEQFDKIQSVLNYSQKIIRSIPSRNRLFNFGLSLVQVNYNFIGFHPKGIKFSFDVQNVVTAFIGEDLYKNKLTSLREAVQNSIDSCRYKLNFLDEIYKPSINIYYSDDQIKIDDNGSGMDEFIIENFFGKLASSFYEQEKIKSKFEAIGQFGVGVFSYFLMSEYVDIETKMANRDAVKFRFDKDPKSYFHFYDKTERNEAGTTITMHLKKDLVEKLSDKEVIEFLKSTFRHVEIPINLNTTNDTILIEARGFDLDNRSELIKRLKFHYKKALDQLELVTVNINDSEIEGTCALIISKDYLNTFSFIRKYLDSEAFYSIRTRHSDSQISFSQKGVFVNNYESTFLNLVIGAVNIKKKIKINIDRNEFKERADIHRICLMFEIKILKTIFEKVFHKCKTNEEKVKVTNDFLDHYISLSSKSELLTAEYIDLLKNNLHVSIYINDKKSVVPLGMIYNNIDEFIILSNEENYREVSLFFNKPILIVVGNYYSGNFDAIEVFFLEALNFHSKILANKNKFYELIVKKPLEDSYIESVNNIDLLRTTYHEIKEVDSTKIIVSIWINKEEFDTDYYDDTYVINYNHFYMQFIRNNFETIRKSREYSEVVKSSFSFLGEMIQKNVELESIQKLNEILEPLNDISYLQKITIEDF